MLPLVVDLDGTLIQTDLLVESAFALVRKNPFFLFLMLFWLFKGKAVLKREIAKRVELEVANLPYNELFLTYLREQKQRGRPLILATASHEKYAQQVALFLPLFDQVIATSDSINLSGENKRIRLVQQFGEQGFDYAGNAKVDLKVWKSARKAIVVNPDAGLVKRVQRQNEVDILFQRQNGFLPTLFKAIRVHQWSKNFLVFIPLLTAHHFFEPTTWQEIFQAFFAFSLCASSVYLLNDVIDLPEDRKHKTKKFRPIAAGNISIVTAVALIPVLLLLALIVTTGLPWKFLVVLGTYYLLTLSYSLYLKRKVMVDVLTLASLYTLRIIGGGLSISVPLSFWLLAFSMFLFLSLALVKRYAELIDNKELNQASISGRGYRVDDLSLLVSLGGSSGYVSVMVFALYLNSGGQPAYTNIKLLWIICPILLYWISRVWVITHRGQMHDDPIVFALKDRVSQLIVGVIAVIFFLAL